MMEGGEVGTRFYGLLEPKAGGDEPLYENEEEDKALTCRVYQAIWGFSRGVEIFALAVIACARPKEES